MVQNKEKLTPILIKPARNGIVTHESLGKKIYTYFSVPSWWRKNKKMVPREQNASYQSTDITKLVATAELSAHIISTSRKYNSFYVYFHKAAGWFYKQWWQCEPAW